MNIHQAKNFFWYVCDRFAELGLVVNDMGTKESVQVNLSREWVKPLGYTDNQFATVQYYGGDNLLAKGEVRAIELRFYKEFLFLEVLEPLLSTGDGPVERQGYYGFQFSHGDLSDQRVVNEVCQILQLFFIKRLGKAYQGYKEVPASLRELPRANE